MSLAISLVTLDPETQKIIADEYLDGGRYMAGPESWRSSVYGSAEVISRGAVFLPQLQTEDLIIFGEDLVVFLKEVSSLMEDVQSLANSLGHSNHDVLAHRLGNIHLAIIEAIDTRKGVWLS